MSECGGRGSAAFPSSSSCVEILKKKGLCAISASQYTTHTIALASLLYFHTMAFVCMWAEQVVQVIK